MYLVLHQVPYMWQIYNTCAFGTALLFRVPSPLPTMSAVLQKNTTAVTPATTMWMMCGLDRHSGGQHRGTAGHITVLASGTRLPLCSCTGRSLSTAELVHTPAQSVRASQATSRKLIRDERRQECNQLQPAVTCQR